MTGALLDAARLSALGHDGGSGRVMERAERLEGKAGRRRVRERYTWVDELRVGAEEADDEADGDRGGAVEASLRSAPGGDFSSLPASRAGCRPHELQREYAVIA